MTITTVPDLLQIVNEDTHLKKVASTNGGEWSGPCPLPGCTSDDDALNVWPNEDGGRWWCRKCGRSGDVIAYMVESNRMTEHEAGVVRHADDPEVGPRDAQSHAARPEYRKAADRLASDPLLDVSDPPGAEWQTHAFEFVAISQDHLWSSAGERAMAWLHKRGFEDRTIRLGGLGYNPADTYESRAAWGLPNRRASQVAASQVATSQVAAAQGGGSQMRLSEPRVSQTRVSEIQVSETHRVWLPRGIVIPWFIGRHLWRVNIRRPVKPGETPKYIGPAGYTPALYGADALRADRPAILVEGEFDTLAIEQATAGAFAGVAVGSATHAHRIRWVTRLAEAPVVLAAFDTDEDGEAARRWWLERLPNACAWLPKRHDVAAMLEAGDDLTAWARAGRERAMRQLERSAC